MGSRIFLFLVLSLPLFLAQNAEYFIQQGDAAMKEGMFDMAISHYSNAIQLSPNEVTNYYKRAATYLTKGSSREALSDLNKVLKMKPDFIQALIRRGKVFLEMGQYSDAKKDYETAKTLDPTNSQPPLGLKQVAEQEIKVKGVEDEMARKNFPFAKELVNEVLMVSKDSPKLRLLRAHCNLELGDYQSMLDDTTRALKVDSANVKGYLLRGQAVFYMGDTENAVKFWRECLRNDPDNKPCRDEFKKSKKLEKAIQDMNDLVGQGNLLQAISIAQSSLQIDAKATHFNNRFRNSICEYFLKIKKSQDAINTCTEALQYDDNIDVLLNRAEAYMLEDDFDNAIRDYRDAQQKDNGNRRAHDGIHNAERRKKMAERKDYYKILGVARDATVQQIKKAYRKLALQYHPDKLKSITDEKEKEALEKKFYDINEAHEILSDAEKRDKWDRGEDVEVPQGFNPFHQHFGGGQTFTFHFGG
eukprot:TRINITY_DN5249_c0_g1_i1.p1 TRINITY_DN5249_c0_g1~~TRINITY_DN5249_c0_g1_i1.p1  ORF type:complete len:473 (-),score=159.49 TRINITY_DN5249_c0_g1_i1:216-1634(-)